MKIAGSFVGVMLLLAAAVFPPPILAGDLNPPGAPAPTMKTLDQISPTWDQKLPAAQRFKLVMDGAAVLDKETGLVWEQSPGTLLRDWGTAVSDCIKRTVAGRKGWRLPTVEELASLIDTSESNPALPAGHPFNVTSSACWSATSVASSTTQKWEVTIGNGAMNYGPTGNVNYVWCVRAGRGYDGQ